MILFSFFLGLPGHGDVEHGLVSLAWSGHARPPYPGAGLSQLRYRWVVPPPHVIEHVTQLDHSDQAPSTGQCRSLHAPVSLTSPSHDRPPYCGAGLSQARVLDLIPSPHVTEHADHSPHTDHKPSTENITLLNRQPWIIKNTDMKYDILRWPVFGAFQFPVYQNLALLFTCFCEIMLMNVCKLTLYACF